MEQFRFLDALTFSARAVAWRPVHVLFYLAAVSLLYAAYYAWTASDAGLAFLGSYAQSTTEMAQGQYGNFGAMYGLIMLASMLAGVAFMAGGYRVLVGQKPLAWLPLQLGLDEVRIAGVYLFVLAVTLGLMFAMMIVLVIAMIVFAIVLAPILSSGGEPSPAVAVAVAILAGLLLALPFVYVAGRISVCFPLTIRDRKLSLGGWKASKGAGMQLLFSHLVIYTLALMVQFALMPDMWTMIVASMTDPSLAGDPDYMTEVMANATSARSMWGLPLQAAILFLVLGPTAAVAAWDARKGRAEVDTTK
jgi:hypothetical protein